MIVGGHHARVREALKELCFRSPSKRPLKAAAMRRALGGAIGELLAGGVVQTRLNRPDAAFRRRDPSEPSGALNC
jgi:hypothetical protein